MRRSPVLFLAILACSDASAPHHGYVLTTQLSTASAAIGDELDVTLSVSNPTDTAEQVAYLTSTTYAQFKPFLSADWQGSYSGVGLTGVGNLVLTPGQAMTLGQVAVGFYVHTADSRNSPAEVTPTREFILLDPGLYSVRACTGTPAGAPVCGNGVPFTLTQ